MARKLIPEEQTLAEVVVVLKALADPNRLRIFSLLMQADCCNCQLNERLGLPSNLLSHHLNVLRQAGLVANRRGETDARWIFYSVNITAVSRWRSWLGKLLDPAQVQAG